MISTYEFGKTFFQERNLNRARCGLWDEREEQRFVQDNEEAERDSLPTQRTLTKLWVSSLGEKETMIVGWGVHWLTQGIKAVRRKPLLEMKDFRYDASINAVSPKTLWCLKEQYQSMLAETLPPHNAPLSEMAAGWPWLPGCSICSAWLKSLLLKTQCCPLLFMLKPQPERINCSKLSFTVFIFSK